MIVGDGPVVYHGGHVGVVVDVGTVVVAVRVSDNSQTSNLFLFRRVLVKSTLFKVVNVQKI